MKENKEKHPKQPDEEEKKAAYSKMAQNMERTRTVVRNSISRASTVSAEGQMALNEEDFTVIKKKMDKIDQRLDDLYKNWHVEYGNATTLEECNEIKRFYKPYLEKIESKFRILYHLLQLPSMISTHESISGMTPSLATLDDAPSLKQREWIRGEPGEDVPRQYSSIGGHLTPTTPRHEDMRLEPSLNVTPEGSLADIPAAVERERKNQLPEGGLLGTSSETTYMEIPDTCVKTVPESSIRETPRVIQRTKEASREEVIASTQQFFPAIDRRNTNVTTEGPIAETAKVHERDIIEVPEAPTSMTATTLVVLDVEPRGASSPRISLPEGSPSCSGISSHGTDIIISFPVRTHTMDIMPQLDGPTSAHARGRSEQQPIQKTTTIPRRGYPDESDSDSHDNRRPHYGPRPFGRRRYHERSGRPPDRGNNHDRGYSRGGGPPDDGGPPRDGRNPRHPGR